MPLRSAVRTTEENDMAHEWKAGDWVVFDLSIGQIKELREDGGAEFSDGSFATSGFSIAQRFRPLTLQNKRIVENLETYYKRLYDIDGSAGFNFPDISRWFSQVALDAIDNSDEAGAYERAQAFIRDARDHKAELHGIRLFRPALRRASA
jgi:hypothetical protein